MIDSKKGTVIYWTIFALATAMIIIIFATLSPSKQTEYKGEIQLSLLKAGYIAENKLIYADMAALFSANHAAVMLAENGGFYSDFPCGNFSGYAIWNNENGSCVLPAENITLNFFRIIKDDLAEYMDYAPFKGETEWLTPDISVFTDYSRIIYDLSIRGTKLIGIANNALELTASLRKDKAAAYYTKPSFNVDIGYDVGEYETLISKANLLVAKCRANDNTLNCIKGNMAVGWELREDLVGRGGIFAFGVASSYKIIQKGGELKPVVYKFALYFKRLTMPKKIIFIPVNWPSDETSFKQKAETSFDYFVEHARLKGDETQYIPMYEFKNLQFEECPLTGRLAVEKVETHADSSKILFDKNKDKIVAFAEELGECPGFAPSFYPWIVFAETEPSILTHELGHALFGYCDEYEYTDIKCPDSIEYKELVEKIIYNNMESVINALYDFAEKENYEEEVLSRIQGMNLPNEYISKYTEEEKNNISINILNALIDCDYHRNGWLPQHYKNKYNFKNSKTGYDGCTNPYPICCADSPNYDSTSPAGINCYPDNYDAECAPFPCAGAPCGENCRSIMGPSGLCAPITSRNYP